MLEDIQWNLTLAKVKHVEWIHFCWLRPLFVISRKNCGYLLDLCKISCEENAIAGKNSRCARRWTAVWREYITVKLKGF